MKLPTRSETDLHCKQTVLEVELLLLPGVLKADLLRLIADEPDQKVYRYAVGIDQ